MPTYTSIGVAKYGMTHQQNVGTDHSAAANGAVSTSSTHTGGLNPENPMLWLVGIGAVTLGLVAFSTHVRVGKFAAGVDAGTP